VVMGVVAVNPLSVSLAWTPGDDTELSPLVVYAVLAGASFVIVLFTGLLAFWLNRRARRARRLQRAPVPRPRMPAAAEPVATARVETTIDLDRYRGNGNGRTPAQTRDDPSGEYALMRAAAARAATVAAQAKHTSAEAANVLDTAERVYEEARRAHAESLTAAPEPAPTAGPQSERDVARAALDAFRRGEITAEELRRVWFGISGWDGRHDEAEREVREFETAEIRARHQYHVALAQARVARQAEYVADTAVRALGAEAAAAAAELAAAHGNGNGAGKARRWRRSATGAAR
jgi:hypothetical protein